MRDKPPMIDHWGRFRRLITLVLVVAVISIVGAVQLLRSEGVVMRPHFMIALGLGIGLSLLLGGVLMGLVFVSANSGHDDKIDKDYDRR